jgi:hypothetical protein
MPLLLNCSYLENILQPKRGEVYLRLIEQQQSRNPAGHPSLLATYLLEIRLPE